MLEIGGYRETAPAGDLAPFVEGFWTHSPPGRPVDPGAVHRVIPHFSVSLAFEREESADGKIIAEGLYYLGPVSTPRPCTILPGREMVAVRVKPEASLALLGIEPREHWNAITDYRELAPARATPLFELLSNTRSTARLQAHLESWIRKRVMSQTTVAASTSFRSMSDVVGYLRETHGWLQTDQAVRDLGWTPQYMRRLFRDHLGETAKRIACLFRLNRAVESADHMRTPDWADISTGCGYADQSHLINECRRWTGAAPVALHRERRTEQALYLD